MTYRGRSQNGVAVLDPPAHLPDGTAVRIEVEPVSSDFWQNKSLEDLALQQGVVPIHSAADLAGDWPEQDSPDEFLAFVREARK